MTSSEESRARREAQIERLQAQLARAVSELVSSEDWIRALRFSAQFRSRSFSNSLLIWVQHSAAYQAGRVPEPTPSHVAGFKQWQALGRTVTKGQAGYVIQAPVTARFATSAQPPTEPWRRLKGDEHPRSGEVVRTTMVGVRPAYVWDISQTVGAPVPALPRPPLLTGEAPAGLWAGLERIVRDQGYEVRQVAHPGLIGGANGLTEYAVRRVSVRQDMDDAAQVKTLAHELGHVMMHSPGAAGAAGGRGMAEVEAESVALMIAAAHGLDTSSYTIPYVSSWAMSSDGKSPVEIVKATGERVRAMSVKILGSLQTGQKQGHGPEIDLARPSGSRLASTISRKVVPDSRAPQPRHPGPSRRAL